MKDPVSRVLGSIFLIVSFILIPAACAQEVQNTTMIDNGNITEVTLPGYIEDISPASTDPSDAQNVSRSALKTLSLSSLSSSSVPRSEIEWQNVYGASYTEDFTSIHQTSDGGYIACGLTDAYYANGDVNVLRFIGNGDAWVMKMNTTGGPEWQNVYGGNKRDECRSIRPTSDGGYVLVGFSNSIDGEFTGKNHGEYDIYVVKLFQNGTKQWQQVLGDANTDVGTGIRQTADGGYIITGYEDSSHSGKVCKFSMDTDAWVMKLDKNGNLTWQKKLGGSGGDQGTSIVQTSDGRYLMYGYSSSSNSYSQNHGAYDLWLTFLDSGGNVLDQQLYGGTGFEATSNTYDDGIQLTSDGGFIIVGQTSSLYNGDVGYKHGAGDVWVLKFNSAGHLQWQKTLGGDDYDMASGSIQETSDGGYVFAAMTMSSDSGDIDATQGSWDIWIAKIDNKGDLIKQESWGGSDIEMGGSLEPSTDGGYILSGSTDSSNSGDVGYNHGWSDAWVVKLKPKSLDVPDDVKRYAPNVQFDSDENFYPTSPFFLY